MYVTICKVGAIPEGQAAAFPVAGQIVAIFHYGGTYYAINDLCPHMGASLAEGHIEGDRVTCPWHAWTFRVTDGTWCDNPRIKTDSYPVRVVGDDIQVDLPERTGGSEAT